MMASGWSGAMTRSSLTTHLFGTTIDGRYNVDCILGEGAMGVVYAARHILIEKAGGGEGSAARVLKR